MKAVSLLPIFQEISEGANVGVSLPDKFLTISETLVELPVLQIHYYMCSLAERMLVVWFVCEMFTAYQKPSNSCF
jgi:hypothetical protein